VATLAGLWLALGSVLAAGANGPTAPGNETDPGGAGLSGGTGLSGEELERRRALLEKWVFEPVALEGDSWAFHFDRRDGSFVLRDRRSGQRWFSNFEERGFASVRLGKPSLPGGAADGVWLPVNVVEKVSITDKRIRFRGASNRGALPEIYFEIEVLEGGQGVALRFEAEVDKVVAVRLLDRALWVTDSDVKLGAGGDDDRSVSGAILPRGEGELVQPEGPTPWRAGLRAGVTDAAATNADALDVARLGFLPLVKGRGVLLVHWDDPRLHLQVERKEMVGGDFPGRRAVFTTFEFPAPKGELRLAPGRDHELGFIEAARQYRQLFHDTGRGVTLRHKCGARRELRSFLSAPMMRPRPSAERGFAELSRMAERFKEKLEIEQAVFLLREWEEPPAASAVSSGKGPPGRSGARANPVRALQAAGGDAGLKAFAARTRELGYLLGVEVAPRASRWTTERVQAVAEAVAADLVVLRRPGRGALEQELREVATETFGLLGVAGGNEQQLDGVAYMEGFLQPQRWQRPARIEWPLFSATYGHCVRLAVGPEEALGPDDAAAFLVHLLLGEVPVYDVDALGPQSTPSGAPSPGAGLAACFAQEGGWSAGRGFSPAEVFLKNTYMVASQLAYWRYRNPLLYHRVLDAAGKVRDAFYGPDLRVVVNLGSENYREEDFVLPPNGFLVKFPFLLAFHALEMNGVTYDEPAFFVVRSLEGKMYLRAKRVGVYHGFGPSELRLGGKRFNIEREEVIRVW